LKGLIIGISLYFLAQIMVWFQTNSQFIWPWAKNNPLIISMVFGGFTTYIFILGTKFVAAHYGGLVWPGRFIGFSAGMLVFAALTWFILGEAINLKTIISLILTTLLILIQLFWK